MGSLPCELKELWKITIKILNGMRVKKNSSHVKNSIKTEIKRDMESEK